MRAREFYLIERRVGTASPTSISGYVDNIVKLLKSAEDDPEIIVTTPIMLSTASAGRPATYAEFQPAKGESIKIEQEWEKVLNHVQSLPTPTSRAEQDEADAALKEIWKHRVLGTVDDENVTYKGGAGFPLEIFDKTEAIKGSSRKPYNTGNVTEGVFACAIYLRLRKGKDISSGELLSFMSNQLAGSGKLQPSGNKASKTNWHSTTIKNPVQDNLRLIVTLAPNNFKPLKDKGTMLGMQKHINAIVRYVNTVEIQRIQEEFLKNNIIDSITVRAAGTEDEKSSKVDIDIVYYNERMDGPDKLEARYSRSLKSGSVDQFGQKSAGGARYDSFAYDEYEEDDFDKDGNSLAGKRIPGQSKERGAIIERRWQRQHTFWKTFGIDIDTGKTKKDFKDNWEDDWEYEGFDFIDSFKLSYNKAVKQFNKALKSKNDREEVKTFFKALQWHARRNDPTALVTNFDDKKGTFEELDFNILDDFIDKADLTARYSSNLNTGEETKRPGIQVMANSPGNFERNTKDGVEKVQWDAGEIFMKFRLFVGADKITNLIEKGPLIREWTKVASG
jgi:hypothetical protein